MSQKPNRFFRFLGFFLLVLVAVGSACLIWLSLTYKTYVKAHLAEKVREATKGEYTASIQDINISLLKRQLIVKGLEFWPDTIHKVTLNETGKTTHISIKLSIPEFHFDNISLLTLLIHRQLAVGHVYIWQGKLAITSRPRKVDSSRIVSDDGQSPMLKELSSSLIDIINPDITFHSYEKDGTDFICHLKGGKSVLKDWLLNPAKKDTTHLLHAKTVVINAAAFTFLKSNLLYITEIPAVYFNSDENTVRVRKLTIHPLVDNATFYKILGHRMTIWNTNIADGTVTGLDWQQLLHKHVLWASHVSLTEPNINLYFNYMIPSHPQNMIEYDPPRVFLLLPVKVNIRQTDVYKGHIEYTEMNEGSHREGSIFFDDVRAHGTNFTNIDSVIVKKNEFVATGDGLLLKKSKVHVALTLLLTDVLGNFKVEGHATDISAQQLRPPIEALALARVDSVQIHKLDVYVVGNQNYSQSRLNMEYNNLKATILRAKNPPVLKIRPLVTYAANTFFAYKDNPEPGKAIRTTSAYMTRDSMSPYLSLIMKNMKIAAKEMIVKHPTTVSTLTNDKDLKSQKEGFFQRIFSRRHKHNKM